MGTSNWQQIPFCIDALMRIAPSSLLDIGVGFGRWGIITREFCDVWFTRVMQENWAVRVEGVEGYEKSIRDYHRSFYNTIHIGDAAQIIPTLPGPWSVTLYGDVLEHFTKEKALELLRYSVEHSDYVLVNIPIGEEFEQGEVYGNKYEAHLSTWERDEFEEFGLVRSCVFLDFQGRPYGAFVLSKHDPKNLREQLFSKWADHHDHPLIAGRTSDPEADLAIARLQEARHELSFVKNSGVYKWGQRLRTNPLIRAAKAIKGGSDSRLTVRGLKERNAASQGSETWIMGIADRPGAFAVPWDFVDFSGNWQRHDAPTCAFGRGYQSTDGTGVASAETQHDPELRLMAHPWGGIAEVNFRGRSERIDLYAPVASMLIVRPGRTPMVEGHQHAAHGKVSGNGSQLASQAVEPKPTANTRPTAAQQAFIERVRAREQRVVAVHCPRWLGVTSSTRILFEDCYALPETPDREPSELTDAELDHHARILAEAGVDHLVLSGGDEVHLRLAEKLKALRPNTAIDLLWHGSYLQVGEDYVWHIIRKWVDGVRSGTVRGIITVKAGMEDFFRSIGVPSALLLNYVPGEPLTPPEIDDDHARLGLWISGPGSRKTPHAMISAMPMLGNVRLYAAGLEPRGRELVEYLNVPIALMEPRPLPQDRLYRAMRETHLSLYVTFSECCPMLPLESMKQGVPCLVGPTSHLFEDNQYLFDRLVVPFPDRADVIAKYAKIALEERHEIMREYTRYVRGYNEAAIASVRDYLTHGPTLQRKESMTVHAHA